MVFFKSTKDVDLDALRRVKSELLFAKQASNVVVLRPIEAKNEEKKYFLTLQFADYTQVDDARDQMYPGAFNESIASAEASNRKIAFCWQHDITDPIGKNIRIWDDSKGAYCEVELSDFDAVPNAKRCWVQAQEGVLNQASFGYRYDWEKGIRYDHDHDVWHVTNVYLHEISVVTLGCNSNTQIIYTSEEDVKGLLLPRKELPRRSLFAGLIINN